MYSIQSKEEGASSWKDVNNSGENEAAMQAAVDELIESAQVNDMTVAYRLVDEGGSVVYAPSGPAGVQPDGSNSAELGGEVA